MIVGLGVGIGMFERHAVLAQLAASLKSFLSLGLSLAYLAHGALNGGVGRVNDMFGLSVGLLDNLAAFLAQRLRVGFILL